MSVFDMGSNQCKLVVSTKLFDLMEAVEQAKPAIVEQLHIGDNAIPVIVDPFMPENKFLITDGRTFKVFEWK